MPPVEGAWKDDEGVIVWENPVVVFSFVRLKSFLENKKRVREFMHRLGRETNRGEIVFEFGSFLLAIERAKILLDNQKGKKPIDANPSTKVHILIQQLLDWIKYYSYNP